MTLLPPLLLLLCSTLAKLASIYSRWRVRPCLKQCCDTAQMPLARYHPWILRSVRKTGTNRDVGGAAPHSAGVRLPDKNPRRRRCLAADRAARRAAEATVRRHRDLVGFQIIRALETMHD